MKSILAVVLLALVAVAFPVSAYASCPDVTGPFLLGPYYWYQWEWDTSCAGTSGSVSTDTLSCFSDPAYKFTGTGTVTYSHTVTANDPVVDTAKWQVAQFVDFDDPSNSQYNTFTATLSVTHNGSTTSHGIVTWNGSLGDISCNRYDYWYFTAVTGDTITVTLSATNFNNPNTVIKAGTPILFNGN